MAEKLTFNKAIDTIKSRQKPDAQIDILSSLLGIDLGGSGIDFSKVTHFLQDKIGDSVKLVKARAGELEHKVQSKPWKYIGLSLGVGLMGGMILSHRHQKE